VEKIALRTVNFLLLRTCGQNDGMSLSDKILFRVAALLTGKINPGTRLLFKTTSNNNNAHCTARDAIMKLYAAMF
jgi:hypothetical protein